MKKPLKKLAVYVTAIVLAIGFLFPASVLADTGTKTITVHYDDSVYIGKTCFSTEGYSYIGDASFICDVEWQSEEYPVVLEEGKTYTLKVTVTKENMAAEAYDLREYTIVIDMNGKPFPYAVTDSSATFDRITNIYQFTPVEAPSMDQGAGTIDLSKGTFDFTKDTGTYFSFAGLTSTGRITAMDVDESTRNGTYDLDGDGKADIKLFMDMMNGQANFSAYGDVSGKAPITFKLTKEEIDYIKNISIELPYYSTLTVKFSAGTTSISKATIKGITAKTYTGKALKPAPKVVLKGKTLKAGKDYTVSYKNNVNVGKATVTIKGKGSYTGTKTKTFKINPKGTSLKSVAKASKAVKVKWTKQSAKMKKSRISGYQILLATNGKFTKGKKTVNVAGYSKISKKVTGLKGGKRYYVKIRTYKKIGNTKYYSKWSGVKSVKTAK